MGTQTAITHTEGPPRLVGHVYASIRISNAVDEALVRRDLMPASGVRSIHLDDVLVDTGASHLCLPLDLVDELGLEFIEEVQVSTASADETTGLYEGALLEIDGRRAVLRCLALPIGRAPLVGVLPLEELGLQPDLEHQRLQLLPRWGRQTYLRM